MTTVQAKRSGWRRFENDPDDPSAPNLAGKSEVVAGSLLTRVVHLPDGTSYKKFMVKTPDGVVDVDPTTIEPDTNHVAKRLLKYSDDQPRDDQGRWAAITSAPSLTSSMASGESDRVLLSSGTMNGKVFLASFKDGTQGVAKNFVTGNGRSVADLQNANVLGKSVADVVGMNAAEVVPTPQGLMSRFVPEGVSAANANLKDDAMSMLQSADTATPQGMPTAGLRDTMRIRLFDYLTGNDDRHEGNTLVTSDNRVVSIDHDFTFHTGMFQANEVPETGRQVCSSYVTPNDISRLSQGLASLQGQFSAAGHSDWFSSMTSRLNALTPTASASLIPSPKRNLP